MAHERKERAREREKEERKFNRKSQVILLKEVSLRSGE
jgi:hypothetical protein